MESRNTYIVCMVFNPFSAPGSISDMLLLFSVLIKRQANRGRKFKQEKWHNLSPMLSCKLFSKFALRLTKIDIAGEGQRHLLKFSIICSHEEI